LKLIERSHQQTGWDICQTHTTRSIVVPKHVVCNILPCSPDACVPCDTISTSDVVKTLVNKTKTKTPDYQDTKTESWDVSRTRLKTQELHHGYLPVDIYIAYQPHLFTVHYLRWRMPLFMLRPASQAGPMHEATGVGEFS